MIDRHDILRTAFVWEGLSSRCRWCWRHAPLSVTEVALDPADGRRGASSCARASIRGATGSTSTRRRCCAFVIARRAGQRALAGAAAAASPDRRPHDAGGAARRRSRRILDGRGDELPAPLPFRELRGAGAAGREREEHEAFFREMLGDVDEPTAPFGLRTCRATAAGSARRGAMLPGALDERLRAQARRAGRERWRACVTWRGRRCWRGQRARATWCSARCCSGRMQGGEGATGRWACSSTRCRCGSIVDDDGGGGERAADARAAGRAAAARARVAGAGAALQRGGGAGAAVQRAAQLPPQPAAADGGSAERQPLRRRRVARRARSARTIRWRCRWTTSARRFGLTAQVAAPVDAERVCELMHTALEELVEALERAPQHAGASARGAARGRARAAARGVERDRRRRIRASACIHELFEAQVRARRRTRWRWCRGRAR